ncbi:MAG: S-layer homology domain-containing protein [Candidatus Cohnella colombiensis]|uniref:S-layer homology domain-containing protein n=1 Tax=Candidatus Cohnella colombiensis TaxID=3121368 RepID=A0AA95JC21_9BACL|nr:MAG: S-layer homology domain-containing protein [Cohnella sp.]
MKGIRKWFSLSAALILIVSLVSPAGAKAALPSDVQKHWAKTSIERWISEGVVQGGSDGKFNPNKPITRAELIRILNKIFGFTVPASEQFSDVPADAWYAKDLAIAKEAGYYQGYPNNVAKPTTDITREDVAVLLARVFKKSTAPGDSSSSGTTGISTGSSTTAYDFESSIEGWEINTQENNKYNTAGASGLAITTEAAAKGTHSLKADFNLKAGATFDFRKIETIDLSKKTAVSMKVKVVPTKGSVVGSDGVQAKLYIQAGEDWSVWKDSELQPVNDKGFATLTVDLAGVKNLNKVMAVGVQIVGAEGSSGTAIAYVDDVSFTGANAASTAASKEMKTDFESSVEGWSINTDESNKYNTVLATGLAITTDEASSGTHSLKADIKLNGGEVQIRKIADADLSAQKTMSAKLKVVPTEGSKIGADGVQVKLFLQAGSDWSTWDDSGLHPVSTDDFVTVNFDISKTPNKNQVRAIGAQIVTPAGSSGSATVYIDEVVLSGVKQAATPVSQPKTDTAGSGFTDTDQIASYAAGAVKALSDSIKGYPDGTYRPKGKITKAEVLSLLDKMIAGYYGHAGTFNGGDIKGDVIISHTGVILKDTKISGNLYLAPGIGDGDVKLEGVTVGGMTYVSGGGEHTVTITNSTLAGITMDRKDGKVRVLVTGNTVVDTLVIDEDAILELEEGASVTNVIVHGNSKVVVGKGATIENLTLAGDAAGTTITGDGDVTYVDNQSNDITINGKVLKQGEFSVKGGAANAVGGSTTPTIFYSGPSGPTEVWELWHGFEESTEGFAIEEAYNGVGASDVMISTDYAAEGTHSLKVTIPFVENNKGVPININFEEGNEIDFTKYSKIRAKVKFVASESGAGFGEWGVWSSLFVSKNNWSQLSDGANLTPQNGFTTFTIDLSKETNVDKSRQYGVSVWVPNGAFGTAYLYIDQIEVVKKAGGDDEDDDTTTGVLYNFESDVDGWSIETGEWDGVSLNSADANNLAVTTDQASKDKQSLKVDFSLGADKKFTLQRTFDNAQGEGDFSQYSSISVKVKVVATDGSDLSWGPWVSFFIEKNGWSGRVEKAEGMTDSDGFKTYTIDLSKLEQSEITKITQSPRMGIGVDTPEKSSGSAILYIDEITFVRK